VAPIRGTAQLPAAERLPDGGTEPPARRNRLGLKVAGAAAILAVAVTAGTVAWAHGRADEPAAVRSAAPAAVPSPATMCEPGTAASGSTNATPAAEEGTAERPALSEPPISLPDGWRWHVDTAGFALPVPQGWLRTTLGSLVCFTDAGGTRSFAVNTAVPITGYPLRYWQAAEKANAPPGYQKISMGVLLVADGGADWDYTWQPATGPRQRTYRQLVSTAGLHPYALSWTSPDRDWPLDLGTQRVFRNGFRGIAAPASTWAVPPPAR
jgi:hypothetical protein